MSIHEAVAIAIASLAPFLAAYLAMRFFALRAPANSAAISSSAPPEPEAPAFAPCPEAEAREIWAQAVEDQLTHELHHPHPYDSRQRAEAIRQEVTWRLYANCYRCDGPAVDDVVKEHS